MKYFIIFLILFQIIFLSIPDIKGTENQYITTNSDILNWLNKYGDSSNNPVILKKEKNKQVENKEFILFKNGINDEIATKTITYNNIGYTFTKNGNLLMLDLNSLEFNITKLSIPNNEIEATPSISSQCKVLAIKDGSSFVKFFKILDKFKLEIIKDFGPLNEVKHSIISNKDIFLITEKVGAEGSVYRFNCIGDLLTIWKLDIYNYPATSPAFKDDILIYTTTKGTIEGKSLNKSIDWRTTIGFSFYSEPIIYNDNILIISYDIKNNQILYNLDIKTGKIKWKINLENNVISPLSIYQNVINFITQNGTIYQLDIISNKIIKKVTLPKDFQIIKTDLILINSILIFYTKISNKYNLIYYDIINNIYKTEQVKELGDLIGLSLSDGKLIVTGKAGIGIYPIYVQTSLTIKTNLDKINIKIYVNNTNLTLKNILNINYLIKNDTTINVTTEEEIPVDFREKLKIEKWENVSSYSNNFATVKLYQWENTVITIYYEHYFLSVIEIKYKISDNITLKREPILKINDQEIKEFRTFIKNNEKVLVKLYAEPILEINITSKLIFYSWDDGVKENERIVELKPWNFIKLVAIYNYSSDYLISINLNPPEMFNLIFSNLESRIEFMKNNTTLTGIVKPNTEIQLKAKEEILINDTTKIRFLYWKINNFTLNKSLLIINVNNNTKIELIYEYYWYFEFVINKNFISIDYKNNTEERITFWKNNQQSNITIIVDKILFDKNNKITLLNITSINSKYTTLENSTHITLYIILNKGESRVIINYIIEKLSTLIIVIPYEKIKEIIINSKVYNVENRNGSSLVEINDWIYNEKNYTIEFPLKVKIDESKTLIFKSVKDSMFNYTSNKIEISLKAGDKKIIIPEYTIEDLSMNNNFIIALLLVLAFMFILSIILKRFY